MKREPAVIIGAVVTFATAVIGLLVAYNVNINTEQGAAILSVVTALAGLVAGLLTRPKVTPVADPRLPGVIPHI
jgi:hypothetical protein